MRLNVLNPLFTFSRSSVLSQKSNDVDDVVDDSTAPEKVQLKSWRSSAEKAKVKLPLIPCVYRYENTSL